jgi:hypothetical protein
LGPVACAGGCAAGAGSPSGSGRSSSTSTSSSLSMTTASPSVPDSSSRRGPSESTTCPFKERASRGGKEGGGPCACAEKIHGLKPSSGTWAYPKAQPHRSSSSRPPHRKRQRTRCASGCTHLHFGVALAPPAIHHLKAFEMHDEVWWQYPQVQLLPGLPMRLQKARHRNRRGGSGQGASSPPSAPPNAPCTWRKTTARPCPIPPRG